MKIQAVVTHFSEPWELVWQLHDVLRHYLEKHDIEMIIYHKGGDEYAWNDDVPENTKVVSLENVGREAFVVHYHIYHYYDNLPDMLMFIPANWKGGMRMNALSQMLQHADQQIFLPLPAVVKWETEQYFTIDKWHGLTDINRAEVQKQTFTLSSIRPFGAWFQKRIPVAYKDLLVLNGTFSIPRGNILRYPRTLFEDWLNELKESGPNPEIGHYWERTWYALFG